VTPLQLLRFGMSRSIGSIAQFYKSLLVVLRTAAGGADTGGMVETTLGRESTAIRQ
jgi:hypothetical protein